MPKNGQFGELSLGSYSVTMEKAKIQILHFNDIMFKQYYQIGQLQ